jgi:hypothetical protein
MKKILIIVLLLLSLLAVYGQNSMNDQYGVRRDAYERWSTWSVTQKNYYIWGALSGAWAMGSDIAYESGYMELLPIMNEALPRLTVEQYRISIDYIYKADEFKSIPVVVVMFRLTSLLEERKAYD